MSKNDSNKKTIDNTTTTNTGKKKKPFILRFLKGLLIFLLVIILIIAGWIGFCSFNKTESLNAIPSDFSAYVRTDSIWDAVEPVLDLKAADILLANEPLVTFRETFLQLRESKIRNNYFVSYALSRRVDAALYNENSFLGVVDMGFLSAATRLSPVVYRFFSIPNLVYAMAGNESCFEYRIEDTIYYFKPYKNLFIVTNDKAILHSSLALNNESNYSKEQLKLLKQPLTQPFRITADGNKLLSLLEEDNQYIQTLTQSLTTNQLSEINFGITDNDIDISIKIPFEVAAENKDKPLAKLVQKDSKVPVLLNKLPNSVQYYTFLTAGNLSELKDAAFEVFTDKPELKKKWQDAGNICKMMFKASLEDILFSWTADEYAVLGIEGKAEPVFAIKVGDEVKRQYIFDTILSSIVFKANNSLLLDGIRMPRIEFPAFLQTLIEGFGINLPKPYYMVKDGFVYFSQSPENLAAINAAIKSGAKISKNENWQKVSEKHNSQSSVSLFYDLERSVPFFIKKKSTVSDILQLYNIGRTDVMIQNNVLYLTLQASACESSSTTHIPGFPIELETKATPALYKANYEKSKMVYWREKDNVKGINILTLNTSSKEINNLSYIIPNSSEKDEQELWALTKEGNVYLLNGKLETALNFPIITGEAPTSEPTVFNGKLTYFAADGQLVMVNTKGEISQTAIDVINDIKAKPSVFENKLAVYEKGFTGTIHILEEASSITETTLLEVEGLAYGSPCIAKIDKQLYTAFITQTGELTVWDSAYNVVPGFPINIDNIFYTNLKAAGKYFIALSSDGSIYRISLSGDVIDVKIPYLSARNGWVTIYDYDEDGTDDIFICGDSNVIYGLNANLEYLNGFPLTGYGEIVFADVNGDKLEDCLAITIDNKLNAWKVRQ